MADIIEMPKDDSLTVTFLLQDAAGVAVDFDSATLTVRRAADTEPLGDVVICSVAGTKTLAGVATFEVPALKLHEPRDYSAAAVAMVGTKRHTLAFKIRVTAHA